MKFIGDYLLFKSISRSELRNHTPLRQLREGVFSTQQILNKIHNSQTQEDQIKFITCVSYKFSYFALLFHIDANTPSPRLRQLNPPHMHTHPTPQSPPTNCCEATHTILNLPSRSLTDNLFNFNSF